MNKFILQEQKLCKLGSKCNEKNKFISIKKTAFVFNFEIFIIIHYNSENHSSILSSSK